MLVCCAVCNLPEHSHPPFHPLGFTYFTVRMLWEGLTSVLLPCCCCCCCCVSQCCNREKGLIRYRVWNKLKLHYIPVNGEQSVVKSMCLMFEACSTSPGRWSEWRFIDKVQKSTFIIDDGKILACISSHCIHWRKWNWVLCTPGERQWCMWLNKMRAEGG